jgi:L-aminopeptidase/D-esterase-like protein
MTGTHWIEEAGSVEWPITITNTHSCGVARDATIRWCSQHVADFPPWALPVAAETWDGWLNDINGFHVTYEHVAEAIESASSGLITEGSVGGGTGMITYEYKGGNGTSSRLVEIAGNLYTVGVFVQANFGRRSELTIGGIPVGRELAEEGLVWTEANSSSVIAIVATDAPLLPHQLKRLARRVPIGLGRTGTTGGHFSGDLFLAFSTANRDAAAGVAGVTSAEFVPNALIDPLFSGVVEAVEEAVLNAMIVNEPMIGRDDHEVLALPHDRLVEILERARPSA